MSSKNSGGDLAFELLSDEDKHKVRNRKHQTSESYPIFVEYIPAAHLRDLPGKLGMTWAPGKKDANGWTAHHDRDMETDLRLLREKYATEVLVTLMERPEMERFAIGSLRTRAEAHGMTSLWFPVRDVDVPSSMTGHHSLVLEVIALLEAGRSVAVHCKGGLGRTGVLVASALVKLGHDPDESIKITREARKGTVQTRQQEEYVRSYATYLRGKTRG